jgi:alkylation response protein AidB-like acyl-CoA dehydrogenase
MIDFSLSPEEKDILASVSTFLSKEVVPLEEMLIRRGIEGVRKSARLSHEEEKALQDKARQSGLWGIRTPERFGGADLSPLLESLINVELGRTIVNFAFGGDAMNVLYHCNDEQQAQYLVPTIEGERHSCVAISEPGGGSDVRAMRTTAIRHGDDFVINGEKMWITGGNDADYVVLFARTPEEGDPEGITGFLVDRDMGWKSSPIPLMGAADDVALLNFTDVRVPARNVLGEVNKGFDLLINWVYSNRLLILAPRNVGACERLLSMAIDWANNRKTFGKALSERENIAFAIAESDMEIRAAKLLALNGAWKATVGQDYRHEAYTAKTYAARAANNIVDRVLQIHGGMGYAMELPIERWYRDLRVQRIYEGTDEVNLAGIARNLFRGNVPPGQIF